MLINIDKFKSFISLMIKKTDLVCNTVYFYFKTSASPPALPGGFYGWGDIIVTNISSGPDESAHGCHSESSVRERERERE